MWNKPYFPLWDFSGPIRIAQVLYVTCFFLPLWMILRSSLCPYISEISQLHPLCGYLSIHCAGHSVGPFILKKHVCWYLFTTFPLFCTFYNFSVLTIHCYCYNLCYIWHSVPFKGCSVFSCLSDYKLTHIYFLMFSFSFIEIILLEYASECS